MIANDELNVIDVHVRPIPFRRSSKTASSAKVLAISRQATTTEECPRIRSAQCTSLNSRKIDHHAISNRQHESCRSIRSHKSRIRCSLWCDTSVCWEINSLSLFPYGGSRVVDEERRMSTLVAIGAEQWWTRNQCAIHNGRRSKWRMCKTDGFFERYLFSFYRLYVYHTMLISFACRTAVDVSTPFSSSTRIALSDERNFLSACWWLRTSELCIPDLAGFCCMPSSIVAMRASHSCYRCRFHLRRKEGYSLSWCSQSLRCASCSLMRWCRCLLSQWFACSHRSRSRAEHPESAFWSLHLIQALFVTEWRFASNLISIGRE